MASNFKILQNRKNDFLHLRLIGDMDGDSACAVINLLVDNTGINKVVVDTSGLGIIFPFGRHVFFKHFHKIKQRVVEILFTGEKSSQLAPEPNRSP